MIVVRAVVFIFMLCGLVLPCADGSAGTLNKAQTPQTGKFSLGCYGEFVNDRNLAQVDRAASAEELRSAELNGMRVLLKPSYAINDLIEVYAQAGIVKNDISTQGYVGGVYKTPYSITFDPDLSYGAGVKLNSDIDNVWFVGADVQFLLADDSAKVVKNPAGNMTEYIYRSSTLFEWQAAVYGARRLDMFIAYGGVKYFDSTLEMTGATGQPDINFAADTNFGIFVGVDIPIDMTGEEDWTTSLELIFADELSFGVGFKYGF